MKTIPFIYTSPELEQLRHLVADARAQLAELETDYTKEKSRVDVVQAALFWLLREHYQKRDRLRLTVNYRQKSFDSLTRGDSEAAKQEEQNYEQAKTQSDKDYEELAVAAYEKKQLTAEQEAELMQLWKKLVKLYHPDRFANEPEKLETYHKLTAAINQAKDNGDIQTLREIAEDPEGFLFRKGWATLDFSDKEELTQLRRLHETLQKEIAAVAESLKNLRESPDYELCRLAEQKPGVLDELAAERAKQLEIENVELEKQAEQLASKIKKLTNQNAIHSMHMKAANLGVIIAKLIAAAMLFAALDRHAYDYYTILRWIACGVCAYTAFQAEQKKELGWLFVFVITALVLNPISPLRLKRDTWSIVDTAAAVLLLVSIVVMDVRKPRP
jgi:hypothetical protein